MKISISTFMYSIDQFSKITDINKLVLRTWENRYGLFQASRTNTNIRVYSDDLLIQALNIKLLTDNGYKISFLAKKEYSEINKLLEKTITNQDVNKTSSFYVNKFIEAALSYDVTLFNTTYEEGVRKFGVISFYENIILATFSKIGLFWLTNRINPGQEHFLSELMKQKILAAIEKNNHLITQPKNWLLFLPPKEHHEIGLIFAKLLLIQNGYEVIYLGANVPLESLDHIANKKNIDNILFFSVSNFSKQNIIKNIQHINSIFKKTKKFLVSDAEIDPKKMKETKTNNISNINQFLHLIQT